MQNTEKTATEEYGTLYIVATPIGNSGDLSPRARRILEEADMIAAEDTRRSMVLLNKLGIRNRLVSNHKFNEYGKSGWFVERLREGQNVAVVTDAGTPCISDPGNELIKAAVEAGIRVSGIPGCCAAVNALAVSGFDLSTFTFLGFFPRENAERQRLIERIRQDRACRTFALYESPKRIMDFIDFLVSAGADCRLCVANDMTKLHETDFRGTPGEVKEQLLAKGNYDKGEYAVVLEAAESWRYQKREHVVSAEGMLADALAGGAEDTRSAIETVLADRNNSYSRNELKAAALRLKKLFGG
ncbi:MAG: 16S rRNA (cytidine(1402)-2'-O)-methyltransferase [Oscillospiraceae bacterium]|nr:16S rRNA (cytidine(1402)-2'-O)-methyltransferase [Oscillospiraceae bacterium]